MVLNTWDGSTDTDWDDGTNWDQGHKPEAGEDVLIPNVTNDPVTTGDASIHGDLTIQASAKLTISAGDTLTAEVDNKTLTVDAGGHLKLAGTLGNLAVFDCNSLADFTLDIDGYLEMVYGKIDNMNNAVPIDIEDGWIMAWNSEIVGLIRWRFAGCARVLQLIETTVTKYLITPTLTSGTDAFTFDVKYSGLQMTEADVWASAGILKGTARGIKTGQQAKVISIKGACLSATWDKISELRGMCLVQSDLSYKKWTFMCGDQTDYAIAGYLTITRGDEGPLYPKFYTITIKESRF